MIDTQFNKVTLPERAIGAPALANPNGITSQSMVLAWTGIDAQHHLNVISSTDGKSFSGKTTLDETSIDGPGLAIGNGTGFITWTGTDQPIMSTWDAHRIQRTSVA